MKKWPTMFSDMADDDGNIPDFEDESGTFNPEKIADRKAVSAAVTQILDSLPYDQRTALWMVYGQQVTIKEMAANLGISENTIKSRLYQGRQKLMARKDDFRKYGIELTAIPVSVLVAMAFQDTVYAAETVGAAAGAAAALHAFSEWSKKAGIKEKAGEAVKHMKTAGEAAGTAAGKAASAASEAAKASGIMGKIAAASVGTKAAVAGVGIVVVAAGGVAVNHANASYMEPIKEKIEGFNDRNYGMQTEFGVYYPDEVLKQIEDLLENSDDYTTQDYYEQWENEESYQSALFQQACSDYDARFGDDWKITYKKKAANKLPKDKVKKLNSTYHEPYSVYPQSMLPAVYMGHSEEEKELENWFEDHIVKEAYELTLDMKIDGSKGRGETEAEAIVVNYGGNWLLYAAGSPDDLVYYISFRKVDDSEMEETKKDQIEETSDSDMVNNQGTLDYDNETNRNAVAAYYEALTTDSRFVGENMIPGAFCVMDVNEDGVYEAVAYVFEYRMQDHAYFLSYQDGLQIDPLPEELYPNFSAQMTAVIPGENCFLSTDGSQYGVFGKKFRFDGKSVTDEGDIQIERWMMNPETEELFRKAKYYDLIQMDSESLDYYLSGSGRETEQAELEYDEASGYMVIRDADARAGAGVTVYVHPDVAVETDSQKTAEKKAVQISSERIDVDETHYKIVFTAATENGETLWEYVSEENISAELDSVGFLDITEDKVYIYDNGAVIALSAFNGEEIWRNTEFTGGNAACITDEEGNLYICGYYGPDIMKIDPLGKTVYRIQTLDDQFYWPYQLDYIKHNNTIIISFDSHDSGSYENTLTVDAETGEIISNQLPQKTGEKNLKDKSQMNQKLLSYARNLLEKDKHFSGNQTMFSVFDVDLNGIYEVWAHVPGADSSEERAYLIYIDGDGDGKYIELLPDYFEYNPDNGYFIASKIHMGTAVEVYAMSEGIPQEVETFMFNEKGTPKYEYNPEENDVNYEKYLMYSEGRINPKSVLATTENLNLYLSGDGIGTEDAMEKMNETQKVDYEPEVPASNMIPIDLTLEIAHIRETYAYTNKHLAEYEKTTVNKNTAAWDYGYNSTYYYDGDVQEKQIVDDGETRVEIYGKNPALIDNALPTQETWSEVMTEFIFATVNGAEYRIYMKDGVVIRYIGPDHVNVDYEHPINLNELCLKESQGLSGGDAVTGIITLAFPGWWTAYEGEEN